MPVAPSRVLVVAPDKVIAEHAAWRCGIKDRQDWVWVRDPRMIRGLRKVHIVEAYSTRPWPRMKDAAWKKVYESIQAETIRAIKDGMIDVYALVNFL